MRPRKSVLCLLLAFLALAPRASAEEHGETEDRRVLGSDPSEIVSRIEIRNEYLHVTGGWSDATILRGDWAPTRWILGRLEIPLVAAGGEHAGAEFGLGDLLVGVRGKIEPAERWSFVAEMAGVLDTATSPSLGTGTSLLAPQAVIVWKPSPPWILGLQVQWLASVGGTSEAIDVEPVAATEGASAAEKIRETAFRPQALWHLPHGFWLLADPRIYVDHVDDTRTLFFPTGEFGNVVARHVEVWVRGGGRAAGEGREERSGWVAEAGVRYLFD